MTELATQELARSRAARIRAGIGAYMHTLADVSAAYAQRDWEALGYDSWESYVEGEYSAARLKLTPEHRQKAVAELRLAGMSQRAIGTALGVSAATVNADLAGVQDRTPDVIQGADGKAYPATRPTDSGEGESCVGAASLTSADHPREGEADARLDAARTAASEAPTGAATPVGAGANFGEVLDRLVPDPNPHREWQSKYLDAISGVHKLMRFTADDVAERGDEQCIEELIRVADLLAEYRLRVVNARVASMPDNVTPIRRIS